MSRVIQAPTYGEPEDLRLVEVAPLTAEPGRVVVAVKAAAVNPADLKQLRGYFGRRDDGAPIRLGSEVAGVVTAVGDEVADIVVGDEVIVSSARGGFADEVSAAVATVYPKPAGVSFAEASGLLSVGTTAWHLLEATRVGAGDVVLVHGASGGVGSAVVQLATLRDARVIGTASAASADRVRELGAEPVEYGPGLADRVRAISDVDVCLDTVGTDEAVDTSLELVADRSRIATIVAFDRASASGFLALGGGPGADPGTDIRRAAKPELLKLAAEGRYRQVVAREYPLDRAAEALRFVERGHPGGKVVLSPAL